MPLWNCNTATTCTHLHAHHPEYQSHQQYRIIQISYQPCRLLSVLLYKPNRYTSLSMGRIRRLINIQQIPGIVPRCSARNTSGRVESCVGFKTNGHNTAIYSLWIFAVGSYSISRCRASEAQNRTQHLRNNSHPIENLSLGLGPTQRGCEATWHGKTPSMPVPCRSCSATGLRTCGTRPRRSPRSRS